MAQKKTRTDKTWDAFKKRFTHANNHRLKTTDTGTADYSANAMNHTEVQDMIHGEVHSILLQHHSNDYSTITDIQNPPPAANAVTMDAIRQLIQDTMSKNMTCKPVTEPTPRVYANPHEAIIDGKRVTYCWSHGVTRNLETTIPFSKVAFVAKVLTSLSRIQNKLHVPMIIIFLCKIHKK
mmetsp:Transcript_19457/g.22373  ORF Transcript_19457/g.22373 Transcript_19457/m.22373 type:complete len:180 (-) Transcript_19457:475-1014(-)